MGARGPRWARHFSVLFKKPVLRKWYQLRKKGVLRLRLLLRLSLLLWLSLLLQVSLLRLRVSSPGSGYPLRAGRMPRGV